jgi:anti-sigma regulatory factor (Ser/Thr protein kinase)
MDQDRREALVFEPPTSIDLPDSAEAPRIARGLVAAKWREWGMETDDLAPTLLTSEVVTNALRHSYPPRRLSIAREPSGSVLVQVSDASPAPPVRRVSREADSLGGRGIWLLDQLADRWGHETTGTGKRVWFIVSPGHPAAGIDGSEAAASM